MCIAIYQPKGKRISLERLFNSKNANPHGFGVSWATQNKKLNIFKTMNFDEFLEKYSKVNRHDCLLHFRLASIGKKDKINCHPFRINKNLVMVHNGTIRDLDGAGGDKSDTRTLAHDYIRPMCKIKGNFVSSTNGKRWLSTIAKGMNKLVFMNQHGTPTFINGDLGHWSMGCWYSNKSYDGGSPESGSKSADKSIKRHKFRTYPPKGYKYLSQKATSAEVLGQQMPLGFGRYKDGRSIVDEIEEEVDLWADVKSQIDEIEDCNSSNGFDCAEDSKL